MTIFLLLSLRLVNFVRKWATSAELYQVQCIQRWHLKKPLTTFYWSFAISQVKTNKLGLEIMTLWRNIFVSLPGWSWSLSMACAAFVESKKKVCRSKAVSDEKIMMIECKKSLLFFNTLEKWTFLCDAISFLIVALNSPATDTVLTMFWSRALTPNFWNLLFFPSFSPGLFFHFSPHSIDLFEFVAGFRVSWRHSWKSEKLLEALLEIVLAPKSTKVKKRNYPLVSQLAYFLWICRSLKWRLQYVAWFIANRQFCSSNAPKC